MEKFTFIENQRFNRGVPFFVLIVLNIFFLYGIYYQVIDGNSFGNNPLSNKALILVYAFILLLTVFMTTVLRLQTKISNKGIYVRFFPVQQKFKEYSWSDISSAFITEYNPLKDYGGWGYRLNFFKSGKAYNVSGNSGLQIILFDGSKILIGTRKKDELKAAIGYSNNLL